MRLLTLSAAFLAATTHAIDDLSAEDPSPSPEPTPVGALWTASWDSTALNPYTIHCRTTTTYTTPIYSLAQLYPDLKDFAPQLKVFYNKQLYAGSWGGIDVHGVGRELIKMDMKDVPYRVREWLKRNGTQKHFSVQGDQVFFAPGAMYPILPLWVDEASVDGDVECEGIFDDLENYSNEPRDRAVIGKVQHTNTGDKEVKFTIEAMLVKKKGAEGEEGRDEL